MTVKEAVRILYGGIRFLSDMQVMILRNTFQRIQ